jgi:type IV pilus assembly protein PilE
MMGSTYRQAGVTLTELLVTIAIVAILAAVAYPSFQSQIQSGRRSDAKAELMRLAQYMERIYTESGCYDAGADGTCGSNDDGSPIAVDNDDNLPSGVDGYRFHFSAGPDDDSFTLRATPVDGGVQDGNGFLQINELGQRSWDENDDGDVNDDGENDWERG